MHRDATPLTTRRLLDRPMHRRTFLGGLAGSLLGAACARPAREPVRPNLVLIMTDDQSWDSLGYASGGAVRTPSLDRLARNGMIFDAGHCNAMPCIPSRASMMTGLHHLRWRRGRIPGLGLRKGEWTWAHALRQAGYGTALFGKMHFHPRNAPNGFDVMALCDPWPGVLPDRQLDDWESWLVQEGVFDEWRRTVPHGASVTTWQLPARYHRISWVTDQAIEYLDQRRGNAAPHAVVVSYMAPHPWYDPLESFASLYDPNRVAVPHEAWLDLDGMPPSLRNIRRAFDLVPQGEPTLRSTIAATRALVSQIDDAVGRLVERIDLANTLVVFVSDHGDYLGKRGQMWKTPTIPFEALSRIPFFAFGAGVPPGTRYAEPVSLVDLAPTFLLAAGSPIPDDLDGRPLQNCFRDRSSVSDRAVYCFGGDGFDTIQRHGVKYFRSHEGTEEMLFDLTSDPGELHNLAGRPAWRDQVLALRHELAVVQSRPPAQLPRFPVQHDGSADDA